MTYDHLVIGSGLAGLAYAVRAAEQGGTVVVLTKGEVTDSNTSWAQGGIAAAVGEADSWELHEHDTLIAGAEICDEKAVRFLVQSAPDAIQWLIRLGARFDGEGDDLNLHREGGHSRHRIVHYADKTGWEIERAMAEAVKKMPTISVVPHAFVTDLLMKDGRCVGARASMNGLGVRDVFATNVCLSTGGAGRMYQHTTNPNVATADGIALAAKLGVPISNMEFMQFHPTTLYHPQMRSALISEAVRGAGATLRNHLGRRFMYDYDERLELAPRDVVARSIHAEMEKHGTWCVYLDITHKPTAEVKHSFPTIYETLASVGIEMDKEWIPVVPAQHYSCGGVVTDLQGQTSIPGLFAAGEVACTGVHGGNRLASNSLLEAIVFAIAAADASHKGERPAEAEPLLPVKCIKEADSIRIRRALQRTMMVNVGIVRNFEGLHEAERVVQELTEEYDRLPEAPMSVHPLETRNMLIAAKYVVAGALARKENVGLHFNSDLA